MRGISRFLPNTGALVASAVISTILTVFQVKILAAHLAMDVFGQFASLRGLSLLLSMLAANGLPQLLVRFLPVHEARGEVKRALTLVLVSLAMCIALFALLAMGLAAFEGRVFGELGSMTPALHFWFLATTIGVAVKLVVYGGFSGMRRMVAQTVVETVTLAAQVLWIYTRRETLTLAGLFEILGTIALVSAAIALPWLLFRTARDVRRRATSGLAGSGVVYGGYWFGATGLSIVALAFTDVDRYILSRVLALEILSLFHVAARIVRLANRFLAVPVLAFQPEVSRVEAEGRSEVIALTTRVFLKFNTIVSFLVTGIIIVYGREIIVTIANADYLTARPFLILLALTLPLTTLTAPLTAVMKALDRVRAAFICDLIYALSYVPMLILFGQAYGLMGAAGAQIAACALQLGVAIHQSRVSVGMKAVGVSFAKTAGCMVIAFAIPAVVELVGGNVVMKIAASLPAIFVFRWSIRAAKVLAVDERERLMKMFDRGGRGPMIRWLLG